MEVLAKLKVNDGDTGELLEEVQAIFVCDECEDLDEFDKEHGEDIAEFMENELRYDYEGTGAILRLDVVELADEPAEVA